MSDTIRTTRCSVCSRDHGDGLDFHCASCARSVIYLVRMEYAKLLLEKQSLERKVIASVNPPSLANAIPHDESEKLLSQTWQLNVCQIRIQEARESIAVVREKQKALSEQIQSYKNSVETSKQRIATRREHLRTIQNTLPERLQSRLSNIQSTTTKGLNSIDHIEHKSASNRAYLCREAAILMRLRQKRRQREGHIREQYSITGLVLPDWRELNNARCADLTAVLGSVAHLVVLVAFYLGVRLPAEITVPYKDYPLPTINTPHSSYVGQRVEFPGSGALPTNSNKPAALRNDLRASHRPRPLFVGSDDRDERLTTIAKKEPLAFGLFVEGLALLAWDVAWLCRSQGQLTGTNTWEEICNVGRNLHQLLIVPPQPPSPLRFQSNRTLQRRTPQSNGSAPTHDAKDDISRLGRGSHLSAQNFLGSSTGTDNLRSWRNINYTTVADSLRKTLLTEMNNAEWELLQEQEWDDGGEQFNEAVFVKTGVTEGHDFEDAPSVMTATTKPEDQHTPTVRAPGTSGWTKLKSREKA